MSSTVVLLAFVADETANMSSSFIAREGAGDLESTAGVANISSSAAFFVGVLLATLFEANMSSTPVGAGFGDTAKVSVLGWAGLATEKMSSPAFSAGVGLFVAGEGVPKISSSWVFGADLVGGLLRTGEEPKMSSLSLLTGLIVGLLIMVDPPKISSSCGWGRCTLTGLSPKRGLFDVVLEGPKMSSSSNMSAVGLSFFAANKAPDTLLVSKISSLTGATGVVKIGASLV